MRWTWGRRAPRRRFFAGRLVCLARFSASLLLGRGNLPAALAFRLRVHCGDGRRQKAKGGEEKQKCDPPNCHFLVNIALVPNTSRVDPSGAEEAALGSILRASFRSRTCRGGEEDSCKWYYANGIMQMFSRQMLERRMLDATSASAPASSSPRVAPCTRRSSYSAHGREVAHDSWLEWVPKWPRRRISTSSFEKHEWKASVLAGTATKTSLNSRHRWKVPSTYRACLRTLRK